SIGHSVRFAISTPGSPTSTRPPSEPRSTCRLVEPRAPATDIAREDWAPSISTRSGSRFTLITPISCSARRLIPASEKEINAHYRRIHAQDAHQDQDVLCGHTQDRSKAEPA